MRNPCVQSDGEMFCNTHNKPWGKCDELDEVGKLVKRLKRIADQDYKEHDPRTGNYYEKNGETIMEAAATIETLSAKLAEWEEGLPMRSMEMVTALEAMGGKNVRKELDETLSQLNDTAMGNVKKQGIIDELEKEVERLNDGLAEGLLANVSLRAEVDRLKKENEALNNLHIHKDLRAENERLRKALEHVRDAFWTDGEDAEERFEYLQSHARAALQSKGE